MGSVDRHKQSVRERVWKQLDQLRPSSPSVYGRIPTFDGREEAAERLAGLEEWKQSRVVKSVPDRAQLPVRARALSAGKTVYMASAKLAEMPPFYLLDSADSREYSAWQAADRSVAARTAQKVNLSQMRPIDLVICGSVAVNYSGARLGKGAGYSDIEVALLVDAGLLDDRTVIMTTVHDLQFLEEEDLPEIEHDFHVDIIVTPSRVVRCGERKRPRGISWDSLSEEQISAIPVLVDKRRAL